MVPGAPTWQPAPIFDVHPRTGATIEVFYADRALETFGRCGAGWFWWARQRGCSPAGPSTGSFATGYAAYRHAMNTAALIISANAPRGMTLKVNTDIVRTRLLTEKTRAD